MGILLWQRDIGSDINGVKTTYSSWDACMTKAYCKWPAIIGIIVGSLIVLSILWCLFRCLCCGAECCCGCLACCNSCCPSPSRRRNKNDGYYQQPPPPQPAYQPYLQYQSHPPPSYAGGGYRGAQTATFDAPRKNAAVTPGYNEDALPAMPSWSNATSRHVEEEVPAEDVEMEKLDHNSAQQQSLLPRNDNESGYHYPQQSNATQSGDLGMMHGAGAGGPYHDYDQHQQYAPSMVSSARDSAYPSAYPTSPTSTMYEPAGQHQQWGGGYAQSTAPPSYRTGAPSVMSQPPMPTQQGGQIGRKPVQGTWRDV